MTHYEELIKSKTSPTVDQEVNRLTLFYAGGNTQYSQQLLCYIHIMARMHARTKGKSKSHRPVGRPKPESSPEEKEIISLIKELAKEGYTPSQIGNILRDQHQVLDVKAITGKKLTTLFNEHATPLELPEDLRELIKKAVMLRKHLSTNAQDQGAKRGLTLTEAKVQRLAAHHTDTNKLSKDWKYDWKQYTYLAE